MPEQSFELECDRLSSIVDNASFERLRWARLEGPMLTRMVDLAKGALEGREDYELIDEGSTSAVKRFVLKVHGKRIMAIVMGLDRGHAVIGAEAIERSKYRLQEADPLFTKFESVDEQWMAGVLQTLISRVSG
jgi:hypothetical protein